MKFKEREAIAIILSFILVLSLLLIPFLFGKVPEEEIHKTNWTETKTLIWNEGLCAYCSDFSDIRGETYSCGTFGLFNDTHSCMWGEFAMKRNVVCVNDYTTLNITLYLTDSRNETIGTLTITWGDEQENTCDLFSKEKWNEYDSDKDISYVVIETI